MIVAAYQAAGTIGGALASVFGRTAPADEVIVCDDGSTDGLREALEPVLDRLVFLHTEHGGKARALNIACRAASCEFAAILDADDVYLRERVEALRELASPVRISTSSRPTPTSRSMEM